ncbi:MAG: DSD1 family PLP-dependent enzyme [Clostridia bacterium]|nr:DSD1 family PLP-dependent enzyme [Clostridia bacterium]
MNIHNIETPALILDKKVFEENLKAMDEILKGTDLKLRPHYKSHKCATIAHMQIENGAKGMTCAKLGEAIDLADSGVEDVLIANQITDPKKIRRLAELAGDCRLTVCVDNKENIEQLSRAAKMCKNTIHCLVEYEIGMERCGTTTKEEALELAKEIIEKDNLEFDGIQAYAGHISHMENYEERKKETKDNYRKLKELINYFEKNNVPIDVVSGGSTGTASIKAVEGLYNELQAGSYLFMDSTYKELDLPFKNSLFILTTVVSARDGLAVVDAGVKTCGVDQGMPEVSGMTAERIVASEEHFQLHNLSEEVSIGEKLKLIPGHCCSTVNLYDKIYVTDGKKVIDRIPVTGICIGK